MKRKVNALPHTIKQPIKTRRNTETSEDPYLDDEQLPENSVCRLCGDVYMSGRWYNPEQAPKKPGESAAEKLNEVTCPACRKFRDGVPGGVLTLKGGFVAQHQEEILNLIRNETRKADNINPLERIMSLESLEDGIEITTTNEKLAQKLGRALHKAYSGHIEYKWSEDNRLARVIWHRDA